MEFSRADFDNPAVANARQVSSYGYHYGPIPNPNHGWMPARQKAAREHGLTVPPVSNQENMSGPNTPSRLSSINGFICQIDINEGEMCGHTFNAQPALRRHLRNNHPGATINTTRAPISLDETVQGTNALKKYVLTGAWKNARFVVEPRSLQANNIFYRFASACEMIAESDPDFAMKFGTQFHRQSSRHTRLYLKRPRSEDLEHSLSRSRQPKALLEKQQEGSQQKETPETKSSDDYSKESSEESEETGDELSKNPLSLPGISPTKRATQGRPIPEITKESLQESSNESSQDLLSLEPEAQPKSSQELENPSDEWTTESGEISNDDSAQILVIQKDKNLIPSSHDVAVARFQEGGTVQEERVGPAGHEENIAEIPQIDEVN